MDKKEKVAKKVIPLKNYFILASILLVTFVVTTYLIILYANNMNEDKTLSIAKDIFSEINSNEISNYLLENPNTVIYIANSNEDNLAFEEDLKDLVLAYYIKDKVVYLDTSKIEDNKFYVNAYQHYFSEDLKKQVSLFDNYTNMIYIADGKIEGILYPTKKEPNVLDVKSFLIKNDVIIEND
jgi:hypothetical protein